MRFSCVSANPSSTTRISVKLCCQCFSSPLAKIDVCARSRSAFSVVARVVWKIADRSRSRLLLARGIVFCKLELYLGTQKVILLF